MRINANILLNTIFWTFILSLFFSSCVPVKKQIYLQAKGDSIKSQYNNPVVTGYKLQPRNSLYIKILSLDDKTYEFFNLGAGTTSGGTFMDASIYLNSYYIDPDGYIDLPFIGKVFLKDLTIEETKTKIQTEIEKYLNKTTVIVRLVNYNVTVVGEVNRPGQYKVYQDKINIFEILGLAGDLKTFAKRSDVILVRKTENKTKIYHIDLLNEDLLESDYYYIMPDDIVYVKPVTSKNFAFETFPYTLVISSISLALAIFALIK
jgi:polysaccharide export outer membrane protein